MANYANLISAIREVITNNGNNEITGVILQQTLLSIINSLGSGYQFKGIATPESNPGTTDQRVFYLAGIEGIYANYGNFRVQKNSVSVLKYDTTWHQESIDGIGGLAAYLYINVIEGGWHLIDVENNIAMQYDVNGFDVAKVSEHFRALIGSGGGGTGFINVEEDGFFVIDSSNYVGFVVDTNGIKAKNLLDFEYL